MRTETRLAWKDRLFRSKPMNPTPTRGLLLKRLYETTLPQGRRDESWLESHKSVHSTLSSYWSSIRAGLLDHLKDRGVAQYLEADLDPTHQAEVAQERQSVLEEISSRQNVPKVLQELPNPPAGETVAPLEKKPKTKTRPTPSSGTPATVTAGIPEKQAESAAAPSSPKIPATKRAISVFTRMFTAGPPETGQTCDWDQFVHAMKDVGFSARISTSSAVVFAQNEHGKIIFHRPHPVAKIDPVMLKAIGKRLRKWFAWGLETFVDAVGGDMELVSDLSTGSLQQSLFPSKNNTSDQGYSSRDCREQAIKVSPPSPRVNKSASYRFLVISSYPQKTSTTSPLLPHALPASPTYQPSSHIQIRSRQGRSSRDTRGRV